MRALMGLIKDRHGTYCAQQKVPERLQAAVARVLGNGKSKQVYLKKSLGTKDLKAANIRAKPVQAGFDRTLYEAAKAVESAAALPAPRKTLNAAEIARMAETLFGKLLADDEVHRFGGRAHMATIEAQLHREGVEFTPHTPLASLPEYGWSPEMLEEQKGNLVHEMQVMQAALARGDISAVMDDVNFLLSDFQIDLDRASPSYHELGTQALMAYVRALQAIEKRNAGQPIETPKFTRGLTSAPDVPEAGGTLREALAGWERQRARPPRSVHEFSRSVEMFIQMHGNVAVATIKRTHVREFRVALQDMPRLRKGPLLEAPLPEVSAWGREHPKAQKILPATINKQLGAVQAVVVWANANGLVPEDIGWSDPFSKMRVDEEASERAPFELRELQMLFDAPLFTEAKRPLGAKGDAGVWLPLLALFAGARQGEISGLTVADVQIDANTGTPLLMIIEELKRGRRLKNKMSQRAIPVHSQLLALGFLRYVDMRRSAGDKAWLFPTVAPDQGRAQAAYSKWFGRYLRTTVGVKDSAKVFHSLRHNFKDAARAGGVPLETHDALMGQTNASAVSQGYGAKQMLHRFGVKALQDAMSRIEYPGLDLSRIQPFVVGKRTRIRK
jgi:integrase